jgi:HEAT repeat protein
MMAELSIDRLVEQLSDADGRVREQARHTMALIGDPAVPYVADLLGSSSWHLRWEATKTLASIANPASIPGLLRGLVDDEFEIRWVAAEGLIRVGPESLPPVLRLLLDRPDSKYVRHGARHVLSGLSRENKVIAEIVAPAQAVLGDTEPGSVVLQAADRALIRVCEVQAVCSTTR